MPENALKFKTACFILQAAFKTFKKNAKTGGNAQTEYSR
jgi:hypothetical protein